MLVTNQTHEVGDREGPAVLQAVAELFRALNEEGVRYCHWKSNLRLMRGLRGQTDLDLLVDREHASRLTRLLREKRIKRVLAAPGKRYPGIEDYLGFDPTSGKLFHLHVHYYLVLGEQFVKSYRLPLEEAFLRSVRVLHGVKVPAPELELIVLSLRALLKYRDRDVVKDILSIRSPGIPAHILDEIHWLLGQTSHQEVASALADLSGVVPSDVVLRFLNVAVSSPRDGRALLRLRQKARRALGRYRRDDRFRVSIHYFVEMWRRDLSSRLGRDGGMTLLAGRTTVALVGADGAGKTTLCRELSEWLSSYVSVRQYYLGSKQPSRLSKWLYLFFRAARRAHRTVSRRVGEGNVVSGAIESMRQAFLYSHLISIGYDRCRRYAQSRRIAGSGAVVIYDRFPLQAPLDGPEIHLAAKSHAKGFARLFSRWEQNLYHRFELPDSIVVLDVSTGVSSLRKPDHCREVIEAKNRAVLALPAGAHGGNSRGTWVHVNADQPFQDVLNELKRIVWAAV